MADYIATLRRMRHTVLMGMMRDAQKIPRVVPFDSPVNDVRVAAVVAQKYTDQIEALLAQQACPDCGESKCSATCGYDGPTASDAMADGGTDAR